MKSKLSAPRMAVGLFALVVAASCGDPATVPSSEPLGGSATASRAAKAPNVDIGPISNSEITQHKVGSTKQAAFEQLERALDQLPSEASRQELRRVAMAPGSRIVYHPNAAVARALATVYRAQALDGVASQRENGRQAARQRTISIAMMLVEDGTISVPTLVRTAGGNLTAILLPKAATAYDVFAAVRALQLLRASSGDFPRNGERVRVEVGPKRPVPAGEVTYRRYVERLQTAEMRQLAGVGSGRTITVLLNPVRPYVPTL